MDTINVIIIAIATVIISIVAGVSYTTTNEDKQKIIAIEKGATPAQLLCAFNPPYENTAKLTLCGNQPKSTKDN